MMSLNFYSTTKNIPLYIRESKSQTKKQVKHFIHFAKNITRQCSKYVYLCIYTSDFIPIKQSNKKYIYSQVLAHSIPFSSDFYYNIY